MTKNITIYIDESGNNGEIGYNYNLKKFNFDQRYFSLCFFIPKYEKYKYEEQYNQLKLKYGIKIEEEIKGSKMMTREYNDMLDEFISQFLNKEEFYITLYDKRFLIAGHLIYNIFSDNFRKKDPFMYFCFIELVMSQSDDYFEYFFKCKDDPSIENVKLLLKFMIDYNYVDIRDSETPSKVFFMLLNRMIESEHIINCIVEEFKEYAEISNNRITPNITSLGESLLVLKEKLNLKNKHIQIIHDTNHDIDDNIKQLFPSLEIAFVDSINDTMIQIADNVASIFNKLQTELLNDPNYKKIKEIRGKWHYKKFNEVCEKVERYSIKYCFDLAKASYMQSWMFTDSETSMFEYNYICRTIFLKNIEDLKYVNFDLEEGFNKLQE